MRVLLLIMIALHSAKYQKSVLIDSVDMIEYNTIINDNDKRFSQIILWDYNEDITYIDNLGEVRTGAFVVRDWFNFNESMIPDRTSDNEYRSYFLDQRAKRYRLITAETYVVTYTMHDPERLNQHILPMYKRKGLSE